ncbi:hypothetical protein Vafri_11661 [Volvox africanus]|nr:hypothetical protein Vafri_11661 [Volvox africanus]
MGASPASTPATRVSTLRADASGDTVTDPVAFPADVPVSTSAAASPLSFRTVVTVTTADPVAVNEAPPCADGCEINGAPGTVLIWVALFRCCRPVNNGSSICGPVGNNGASPLLNASCSTV